jgi:ATP-dependent Clp protease adaptor protein ClpS
MVFGAGSHGTAEPAGKPAATAERDIAYLPLFKVLLHNDDRNTMDHVVSALMRVFRFDRTRSEQIMLEAHHQGVAVCTVEPLEQAEFHRDQLLSFSLIATIEQE